MNELSLQETMKQTLVFDPAMIARYDASGPRYTSYPTAVQFHAGFNAQTYRDVALQSNASSRPLSLYFHIPFCDTICFYCACSKVATKDRSKTIPYLEHLYKELALQGKLFDRDRPVEQLHWGGGTPTFLNPSQMGDLMRVTGEHFTLLDDDTGEYSIEIDPREASVESVGILRDIGFNRMSLGVQDFSPDVQKAVNRIQTIDQTWAVLDAARANGFRSISLDLIYGLPKQTLKSFSETLDLVIEKQPDRLSVFNYAHLPEHFKPQRRINVEELPSAAEKLEILQMVGEKLDSAGYAYIGMDHFAKPDDELAIAQREGTLQRNFQGYSTGANCDMVGFGITAIGMIGANYAQNVKDLDSYYQILDSGELPILRGLTMTQDDEIRQDVISRLICNFVLVYKDIERRWGISFSDYFLEELPKLETMADDGLLELTADGIQVRPEGRLLIRNICMVFDAYLNQGKGQQRFSRVI